MFSYKHVLSRGREPQGDELDRLPNQFPVPKLLFEPVSYQITICLITRSRVYRSIRSSCCLGSLKDIFQTGFSN